MIHLTLTFLIFALLCCSFLVSSVSYAHDDEELEAWHAEQHKDDEADDVWDDIATILDTIFIGIPSAIKSAGDLAKDSLSELETYLCSI